MSADVCSFKAEERLLLEAVACGVRALGASPQSCASKHTAPAEAAAVDPAALAQLAALHGVVGLAAEGASAGVPLPDGAAVRLRELRDKQVARSVRLSGELIRLLDLLAEAGLPTVPIKGPVFAHRVYGSIARRSFWDLDLLLRREDVLAAKEVLLSQGYVPELAWSARRERRELRRNCEYNFDHPESGIHVELHWRFMERSVGFDLPMADVWDRLEPTTFLGRRIRVAAMEDECLALIVHNGAKHGWQRLRMIADVAVIGTIDSMATGRLVERAEAAGVRRVVATGVLLASTLLGAQMPELSRWARADRSAVRLAHYYAGEVFRFSPDRTRDGLPSTRAYLAMRERMGDRLRYVPRLARTVLTPTDREQAIIPLPAGLRGIHVIVRPFRLAWKYFSRFLGRLR